MKHEISEELLDQVITVNLPLGVVLSLNNISRGAPLSVDEVRRRELGMQRPDIGEKGLHGIYAGIARGHNDELDGILEVLDEAPEALPWDAARAWAEKQGGRLPTRKEQALLFANVPELFKEEAYWSCEPYAGNESYAWFQHFLNGDQDYYRKDCELRARAVRRLPIE